MHLPATLGLLIASDPVLESVFALLSRGQHAAADALTRTRARGVARESQAAFMTLRAEIALGLGRFAACVELATQILGIAGLMTDIERHVEDLRIRALIGVGRLTDAEARIEARIASRNPSGTRLDLAKAQIALRRG